MRTRRRAATLTTGLLVAVFGVLTGLPGTASAAAAPTCFGKKATIVGNDRNNTIHGTRKDDVIVALNGNDTVYGEGGNDLICGGYGADRLHGGPGNDWLAGEQGAKVHTGHGWRISNDVLFGDSGDDLFSPGFDGRYPSDNPDRISFFYAPNAVTVNANTHRATGEGNDAWLGDRAEIFGSLWGDTMIGGPRRDIFNGLRGHDTLQGNGGPDTLRDDYEDDDRRQDDTLQGGDGADQLFTFGGFDTLEGGEGDDLLSDYSRDAGSMQGGGGNDTINDGINLNARQVVDGGPGTDVVTVYTNMMRPSWPRLTVDLSAGTGTFHTDDPIVFTMRSTDQLYMHGAPLTFIGDAASNLVWIDGVGGLDATGNGGNDVFYGRPGYDNYNGGLGVDKAYTQGGPDTCVSVESTSGSCSAP